MAIFGSVLLLYKRVYTDMSRLPDKTIGNEMQSAHSTANATQARSLLTFSSLYARVDSTYLLELLRKECKVA